MVDPHSRAMIVHVEVHRERIEHPVFVHVLLHDHSHRLHRHHLREEEG
jgi:hypothetical protein